MLFKNWTELKNATYYIPNKKEKKKNIAHWGSKISSAMFVTKKWKQQILITVILIKINCLIINWAFKMFTEKNSSQMAITNSQFGKNLYNVDLYDR